MATLQKHEREIFEQLRARGYDVAFSKPGRGHGFVLVSKGNVTRRVTVSSSPTSRDMVVKEVLRTVERRFKQ